MSTPAQRATRQIWKVQLIPRSPTHAAGFVLPAGNAQLCDPFLIIAEDEFQREAPDYHPHRSMETITYVLAGELLHADNKGAVR